MLIQNRFKNQYVKMVSMTKLVVFGLTLILGIGAAAGGYYYLNLQPSKPSSSLVTTKPVTKEPASLKLDLTSPDDDLLIFQDEVSVAGKTTPHSNILISSQTDDLVTESRADGSFSADFSLKPGVNEIQVVVFDASGDQRLANRTVYYSKERI